MNIQEMISKMSPEMLSKGLKQMSGMLSPEQLKQNLSIERLTHDLRLARARAIVVDSGKEI